MMRLSRQKRVFVIAVALFLLAGAADAALVVSRPGDPAGLPWELGGLSEQALGASWVQLSSLSAVAINVYNLENLDSTGAETSIAFGLASGDINNAPIYTAVVLLGAGATVADSALDFGGPLNLGAGTWFLTASTAGSASWRNGNVGAQVEGLGTFGTEYFNPATLGWFDLADISLGYQVTGNEMVPEPATWALIGGGLALMAGFLRRRRS